MSKAAAIAATGVGGGGAALGGYLIFTNGGSGSGKAEEKEQKQPEATPKTNQLLEEFKNSTVISTDCVKDFSGLKDLKGEGATDISSTSKITKDFFNGATGPSKGCLKMKWDKKTYTAPENGWNGTLKLTWTFEKGNKGFITFLAAKEQAKGQLGLVGLFYALSKTDATWSISHKKEIVEPKEIKSANSTTNFPQVGDKLTDLNNKTFWDFFSEATDLDKVCPESGEGCTTTANPTTANPTTKNGDKRWKWEGSTGENTYKVTEWTKNVDSWWKNLYGDGEINISDIAANETGTWSTDNATQGN